VSFLSCGSMEERTGTSESQRRAHPNVKLRLLSDGGGRGRTRSDRRPCVYPIRGFYSTGAAEDGRAPTEEVACILSRCFCSVVHKLPFGDLRSLYKASPLIQRFHTVSKVRGGPALGAHHQKRCYRCADDAVNKVCGSTTPRRCYRGCFQTCLIASITTAGCCA
jgi:hypothetical protein